MKITKIEFVEHLMPNSTCSTGYSEPDKFHITCNDNLYKNNIWHSDSNEKDIWIDIWYRPENKIRSIFDKEIYEHIGNIENLDEAFEMYKNALKQTTYCPYFWLDDYKK